MKRAWVSGSSSGIGAAVARRLLDDGWAVQGADLAPATLSHERFTSASVDLADPMALAAHLAAVQAAWAGGEPPHALVHAAGLMHTAPLGQLDPQGGAQMWRLHVDAATRLADAWLPALAAAGRGRLVLVGSRVSAGMPGRSQYAATKAALVALARSWAAEVVAQGVTVNVVSPAATDTPLLRSGTRAGSAPRVPPIGRLIQPDEVASLVAYLLSDAAAAITGQDIAICGGASLPR